MVIERPPRQRGPRGPYAKSERTRQAILDAALEVFAQSGYRSGSLRDVAERVGITEAGLLHHFHSKRTLLTQVLEWRDQQDTAKFEVDPDDGPKMLQGLVELARRNASTPGAVELYCTLSAEATSPDHPAHQYFIERYDTTRRIVERAFEDMHVRRKLRDGVEPARAARTVIALFDGLQIQWLLDRNALDMAEELRHHLRGLVTIDI